jgi:hypothetical protein
MAVTEANTIPGLLLENTMLTKESNALAVRKHLWVEELDSGAQKRGFPQECERGGKGLV